MHRCVVVAIQRRLLYDRQCLSSGLLPRLLQRLGELREPVAPVVVALSRDTRGLACLRNGEAVCDSGQQGIQGVYVWAAYLWGFGGSFLDKSGKSALATPEGIAGLEAFTKVLKDYGPVGQVAPAATMSAPVFKFLHPARFRPE